SAIHIKLGQPKLQLVHVAVIANLLGFRDGLQTGAEILVDIGRNVRVPPVSRSNDIGKNPGIANQFLVLSTTQHGNTKRDVGKGVEELGILDQGGALIKQILALVDAVFKDPPTDSDHQVKR